MRKVFFLAVAVAILSGCSGKIAYTKADLLADPGAVSEATIPLPAAETYSRGLELFMSCFNGDLIHSYGEPSKSGGGTIATLAGGGVLQARVIYVTAITPDGETAAKVRVAFSGSSPPTGIIDGLRKWLFDGERECWKL